MSNSIYFSHRQNIFRFFTSNNSTIISLNATVVLVVLSTADNFFCSALAAISLSNSAALSVHSASRAIHLLPIIEIFHYLMTRSLTKIYFLCVLATSYECQFRAFPSPRSTFVEMIIFITNEPVDIDYFTLSFFALFEMLN